MAAAAQVEEALQLLVSSFTAAVLLPTPPRLSSKAKVPSNPTVKYRGVPHAVHFFFLLLFNNVHLLHDQSVVVLDTAALALGGAVALGCAGLVLLCKIGGDNLSIVAEDLVAFLHTAAAVALDIGSVWFCKVGGDNLSIVVVGLVVFLDAAAVVLDITEDDFVDIDLGGDNLSIVGCFIDTGSFFFSNSLSSSESIKSLSLAYSFCLDFDTALLFISRTLPLLVLLVVVIISSPSLSTTSKSSSSFRSCCKDCLRGATGCCLYL